ncbi:hypothetical protein LX69_01630 [Breznakibacter xylanolyticus]|uniref:PKD domain-containing protein n=1 Tax=Breznakibacter xylanolyticus TaxID=990 RepID=A0A2W7NU12_9BACT|nr:hypothetical protein [Breznakibacter xylanolyticus]PZX16816.1 hypothetical protein LX69_01630 [Breznakibacter xylanolyticus]
MKFKYLSILVTAVMLAFTACSPDEYELGSSALTSDDLVKGIAYDYTVDQTTNTVTFTTKEGFVSKEYSVYWDFSKAGNGYSQNRDVKFAIPFAGDYTVYFGIVTKEGLIKSAPINFTIDNTNGNLLTDPLWKLISGGVDKSKTWVLDLDADGASKFFTGPLYFYGTDDSWETVTNGAKLVGDNVDSWNWQPVWADAKWISAAKDFGTMTFDLTNGAHVKVNDLDNGKNYEGTYLLDTENHTISLTNALILHTSGHDAIVTNWASNLKIMSLTEHTMQIAALRDASTEGPCLLVFNYITKAAYDDPTLLLTEKTGVTETPVTDPTFTDLNGQLTTTTTTKMTYTLNEDAPYDWLWWNAADATWESNGFAANSDYPTWAPLPASTSEFSLSLETMKDASGKVTNEFVLNSTDDVSFDGNYTLSGNTLTFSKEVTILTASNDIRSISISGKEFSVLKIDEETKEVWLGAAAGVDSKGNTNKYICVRLLPKKTSSESGATKVICDNSKVSYGFVENEKYLRIQLYNAYGADAFKANPPINATKINFKKELTVTFTIAGLGTLKESTTATIGIMNGGADGKFKEEAAALPNRTNANVTGDGTYTLKYTTETKVAVTPTTDFVFVIDMPIEGKTDVDLKLAEGGIQCPNFTVTVDAITVE